MEFTWKDCPPRLLEDALQVAHGGEGTGMEKEYIMRYPEVENYKKLFILTKAPMSQCMACVKLAGDYDIRRGAPRDGKRLVYQGYCSASDTKLPAVLQFVSTTAMVLSL